ncbi:cell-cell signaling protein C-factor [Vibrio maritimus]|uniref:Cell-cell signaling protein C-factor n=1 Tax=Vibrio maritimus TaxID=990268 RepID=A0A090TDI2_9VIBR|nr:cell-cell signaling protein C-factor [Vibrio maritimus]
MSDLGLSVLIVGGSGGIGWALCKTLSTLPNVKVMATYRQDIPEEAKDYGEIVWLPIDVREQSQYVALVEGVIEILSETTGQPARIDWVINCVGQLSIDQELPEKNLKSIESERFVKAMQINTLPTLLLAQHLQPLLRRSAAPRFATISARVGSISDNGLGGWYSYRCSKAALNMALKNISIEWGRLMPNSCTVALHPGTTDTSLSKPFQANVPEHKLFSADKTARLLMGVLMSLQRENNGQFLAFDGSLIEW